MTKNIFGNNHYLLTLFQSLILTSFYSWGVAPTTWDVVPIHGTLSQSMGRCPNLWGVVPIYGALSQSMGRCPNPWGFTPCFCSQGVALFYRALGQRLVGINIGPPYEIRAEEPLKQITGQDPVGINIGHPTRSEQKSFKTHNRATPCKH